MKFFKALVILLILVLNQTVSSYQLTKRYATKYKALSSKKKSSLTSMSRGKSSFSFSRRSHISNKNKSTHSKSAVVLRTKEAGAILAGVQAGLKVTNIAITQLKNNAYSKILNVVNAEKVANQNFIDYVKEQEILNCETIKLMMETNKYFFFNSELKTVFINSMIQSKTIEASNLSLKLKSGTFTNAGKNLLQHKINSIHEESKSLGFYNQLLQDVNEASPQVFDLLGTIEDRVCNQSQYFEAFNDRNAKLKILIKKIKDKIKNNPQETAGSILSSSADIFGNAIAENESLAAHNFNFSTETDVTQTPIDVLNSNISNVFNFGSYAAQAAENANEISELYKILKEEKIKGIKTEGWLLIAAKSLALIGNATNAIRSITGNNAIVGLVANIITALGKLLELVVIICKMIRTRRFSFIKLLGGLLNFANAVVFIAVSPFSGIISEAISLIKNLFDLYNAHKKLKQQEIESNYYQSLRQSKNNERDNFINYNICVAKYITNKSIFDIIIKMYQFDSKFNKPTNKGNTIQAEKLTENILKSIVSYGVNHGVQIDIKDGLKNICKKYHNICMRSFDDQNFSYFGFSPLEIQHYKDLSLYGPYTDFVVVSSDDTLATFIKIGYELISDKILGCRMCSNDKLIRHVQILPDQPVNNEFIDNYYNLKQKASQEDKVQITKNLFKGYIPIIGQNQINFKQICTGLYKDTKCQTLSFKNYRISKDHILAFETISVDLTQNDNYFAANKILLGSISKNNWRTTVVIGYWDSNNRVWQDCGSNCQQLLKENLINLYGIAFGNPSQIKDGSKVNLGVFNFSNAITFAGSHKFNDKDIKTLELPKFYVGSDSDSNLGTKSIPIIKNDFTLEANKSTFVFLSEDNESEILKKIFNNYPVKATDFKILKVKFNDEIGLRGSFEKEYKVLQFSPFIKLSEQPIQMKNFNCDEYCQLIPTDSQVGKCNYKQDMSHHSLFRDLNKSSLEYRSLYDDYWAVTESLSTTSAGLSSFNLNKLNHFAFHADEINKNNKKNFNFHIKSIEIDEGYQTSKNENLTLQFTIREKEQFEIHVAKSFDHNENQMGQYEYKFQIPVKNIDRRLFVVFLNDNNLEAFENRYVKFSKLGYVMLNKIALKKIFKNVIDDIYYAFILVKPLEGYGMMNLKDKFNNKNCKSQVYSFLFPDYSRLNGDNKDMKKIFKDAYFRYKKTYLINARNFNFQKIYDAKLREFNHHKYNPGAKQIENFSHLQLDKCSDMDVYYPINFTLRENEKDSFRKLSINQNNIVHEIDPIGPGIRPIYWLNFSLDKTKLFNDIARNEEFFKKGYVLLLKEGETIQWTTYDGKILHATVWVSYDYRIKYDRQSMCDKCLQVAKILQ
jgi:hypothetical protein